MPYKEHHIFIDPAGNPKIWRYMDIDKFQSLIERKQLFFAKVSGFLEDPFEGSYPKREKEHLINRYSQKMWDDQSYYIKASRDFTCINCWHLNDGESIPMWKLYGKENKGIAVVSSCQRLKESFKSDIREIHIGRVRYTNYEAGIFYDKDEFPIFQGNTFVPFVCKRDCFKYEQEYRAIAQLDYEGFYTKDWSKEENPNGVFIKTHLDILIEEIYITPFHKEDLFSKVKEILKDKLPSVEIKKSTIDVEPYW